MVELEANLNYHNGTPRLKKIMLKFGSSVVTELLSGNAHIALSVSDMDRFLLEKDPRFNIYTELGTIHRVIFWNQNHSLFRDLKVRKALSHAINRKEVHEVLNLPADLPIFDWPFSRRQYSRRELLQPLPYDSAKSKRLLNESGPIMNIMNLWVADNL